MLTVYGDRFSGNCYKVAWVLHRLAVDHRWVETDILAGETHTPAFLAINPLGKVPLVATRRRPRVERVQRHYPLPRHRQ